MRRGAELLVALLRDPVRAGGMSQAAWTAAIGAARAENLLGSLAHRLDGQVLPADVAALLDDARRAADEAQRTALWEAEMARRALAPLGLPVVLLKGTAFAAAGLRAGSGRTIGDLDILVPRAALDPVAGALLAAGWEWVKDDPYDHDYYRTWMHELPPMIHRSRDRMIDVHHTILPLTATPTPDAAALIADSVALPSGLRVLSREDMIVHAAAHLFADGDLAGGLRNLWDIHCLADEVDFGRLAARAALHRLTPAVGRALRLSASIYGTRVASAARPTVTDQLYRRRLLARDGWGRETRKVTRFGFYVRSHWIRMPPLLLARHLLIKATRRR